MTASRWTFWECYAAFAAVGALAIMSHTLIGYPQFTTRIGCYRFGIFDDDTIGYVAVRSFPRNHRFADGDLRRAALPSSLDVPMPEVGGRYAVRDIPKGTVVRVHDTRPSPVVAPTAGRTLLLVPVADEAARSGAIDAKQSTMIVMGNTAFIGTVEAVFGDKSHSALVNVTTSDAKAILARDSKTSIVLIPIGTKGTSMDQKTWNDLSTVDVSPDKGPWVRAIEYVPGGAILRFECKDPKKLSWKYHDNPTLTCGPNGDPGSSVAGNDPLPLPTAPVGCLIAKMGGSMAATDGVIFSVGSFCVRKIVDAEAGPLYLGINVAASKLPQSANTQIAVSLSEAKP